MKAVKKQSRNGGDGMVLLQVPVRRTDIRTLKRFADEMNGHIGLQAVAAAAMIGGIKALDGQSDEERIVWLFQDLPSQQEFARVGAPTK